MEVFDHQGTEGDELRFLMLMRGQQKLKTLT
jgi:hypothetical protein